MRPGGETMPVKRHGALRFCSTVPDRSRQTRTKQLTKAISTSLANSPTGSFMSPHITPVPERILHCQGHDRDDRTKCVRMATILERTIR
jgi:hypothetical protein